MVFNKLLNQTLLDIIKCPNCQNSLIESSQGFKCSFCSDEYLLNQNNIPIFFPRSTKEKDRDKYENESFVERYTGLFSFGYKILGRGEMESLHRTVSELILSSSVDKASLKILDVGCGVGRASSDCAKNLSNSFIFSVDISEQMLKMAQKIICSQDIIFLNLQNLGFGRKSLNGYGLDNVSLIQANAESLPFAESVFDIVVNVNLLDRVQNPEKALENMLSVLKPGGKFIFTSPLNWNNPDSWDKYNDKESIQKLFESYGLEIEEIFDGLMYREAQDCRVSYSDWKTLVIRANKP